MKRVLTTLALFFFGASLWGQTTFTLDVQFSSSGSPVSNYPVWLKVTPPSGSPYTLSGHTSLSGQFVDTTGPVAGSQVVSIVYDCSGNAVSDTTVAQMGGDTLNVNCIAPVNKTGCNANYHALPSSGLTLNLSDSTNTIQIPSANEIYVWNYGDGTKDTTYSAGASVSHTYAQAGTYNVCLSVEIYDPNTQLQICQSSKCMNFTVGSPAINCSVNLQDSVHSNDPSKVSFYKTFPSPKPAGASESYVIDFGDGTSQSFPGVSTTHVYTGSGYTIATLYRYVMNSNGDTICTDTSAASFSVSQGNSICMAGFEANAAPFSNTVNFTDTSSVSTVPANSIVAYDWDFGDGSSSFTTGSVSHSYSSGGFYNVNLTVSVEDTLNNVTVCSNTFTKGYFVGNPSNVTCNASMVDSVHSLNPNTVTFKNHSTLSGDFGAAVKYKFDFGDGNSQVYTNGRKTSHTYQNAGTYYPSITVYVLNSFGDTICTSTEVDTVPINQSNSCSVDFSVAPKGSNQVQFLGDVPNPNPYAQLLYDWDFGDGSNASVRNPVHSYGGSGLYLVCYTIYALNQSQDTVCSYTRCDSVNALASTIGNCSSYFGVSIDSTNPLEVTIIDSSSISKPTNYWWTRILAVKENGNTQYVVNSSPNNHITGVGSYGHIFQNPGTYEVCQYILVTDSSNSKTNFHCVSAYCDSITVSGTTGSSCTAGFSFQANSFNNPVFFTNSSMIPTFTDSVRYQWDFGDGTTSSHPNPAHIYSQAGNYTVCLEVTTRDSLGNVLCTDSICKTVAVSSPGPGCPLQVSHNVLSGTNSVQFNFTSSLDSMETGTVILNYGDGNSDTVTSFNNPVTHTYSIPAYYNYTVSVMVDSLGATVCSYINSGGLLIGNGSSCFANFSHTGTGQTVNFNNTSSNPPLLLQEVMDYKWYFGDGDSSSAYNPTHVYAQPGNYNVCLEVKIIDTTTGLVKCFSDTCQIIQVNQSSPFCQSNFNVSGIGGSQVNFSNNSTANNFPTSSSVQYLWTFGDGDSATSINAAHSYTQGGNYTVCLYQTVLDSNNNVLCTSDTCMNIQVGSTSNCTATIYALPDGGNSLKFLGAIFNSPVTPASRLYQWDFGDGSTSTAKSPLHTYSAAGSYQVCLDIYALDSLQDTICSANVCKTVQAGAALQNGPGCSAKLSVVPDSTDPFRVTFIDSSSISFSGNEVIASYILQGNGRFWYYSGAGIPGNFSASTLYDAPGTYTACVYHVVTDTVTNQITCVSKDCKPVTVGTPFCKAEYIVDTANSFFGNVYIWNTSDPAYSDPAYSTSYSWDFGDGNGSNQAFPVHVYADPGMYEVCLSINSINQMGDTCTSTFCDSLGVDSLGNLIYKNSNTGFTLNVLNPEDISLEESPLTEAKIFPNPASDQVTVELPGQLAEVEWQLLDLKGSMIKSGNARNKNEIKLDVSLLTPGVYLLSLNSEELSPTYFKIMIDR